MNRNTIKKSILILIAFQIFFNAFFNQEIYAKDNSAPLIKCSAYIDANSGKTKLKLTVTDNAAVKTIKYSFGNHRKSFFKNSFYSKKVKNISVSAAKSISTNITVKKNAVYTFYATDKSGNSTMKKIKVIVKNQSEDNLADDTSNKVGENSNINNNTAGSNQTASDSNEVRAVWITFLEFSNKGYTEYSFNNKITEMFDKIAQSGMNEIYVHVRPFSDAMYRSVYFPWSKYASGTQGADPGFDPLQLMVNAAHARNLKIHAFINPYRVCTEADFGNLAVNNPAYKWLNDDDEDNDRNVLKYDKMYYYNPSSDEVIKLINNGVSEIVKNYDVDGIIFDDYFYPSLGSNYKSKFDADEYNEYEIDSENDGIVPMSIVDWRKDNINRMVKAVYATVKGSGKNITFGISPAGNLSNLRAKDKYYVDIDRWCSESGFVDYIAPQLYWGFEHSICPFEETVEKWMAIITNPSVKLYVALPMHKAQAQDTSEWKENHDILGRMVNSLRSKSLSGFSIFRYDYMTEKFLKKDGAIDEYNNLVNVIKGNN